MSAKLLSHLRQLLSDPFALYQPGTTHASHSGPVWPLLHFGPKHLERTRQGSALAPSHHMPGSQSKQDEALLIVWVGQTVQLLLKIEASPTGHASHATAPAARDTTPSPHAAHEGAPRALANVPGTQGRPAVEPGAQKVPWSHGLEQAGVCRPATAPYTPPGQRPLQSGVARLAEAPKTPGGQSVGAALPIAQNAPAGQATAVGELEPRGQYQPAAQGPLHCGVPRPLVAP